MCVCVRVCGRLKIWNRIFFLVVIIKLSFQIILNQSVNQSIIFIHFKFFSFFPYPTLLSLLPIFTNFRSTFHKKNYNFLFLKFFDISIYRKLFFYFNGRNDNDDDRVVLFFSLSKLFEILQNMKFFIFLKGGRGKRELKFKRLDR